MVWESITSHTFQTKPTMDVSRSRSQIQNEIWEPERDDADDRLN